MNAEGGGDYAVPFLRNFTHMNKRGSSAFIYMGGGSTAFMTAAGQLLFRDVRRPPRVPPPPRGLPAPVSRAGASHSSTGILFLPIVAQKKTRHRPSTVYPTQHPPPGPEKLSDGGGWGWEVVRGSCPTEVVTPEVVRGSLSDRICQVTTSRVEEELT